jgi:hypothetical protein
MKGNGNCLVWPGRRFGTALDGRSECGENPISLGRVERFKVACGVDKFVEIGCCHEQVPRKHAGNLDGPWFGYERSAQRC